MQVSEHDWISKRAYTLWESEGHPHGRDAEHWAQAKKEFALLETSKATKPAHRKKSEVKVANLTEGAKKPKTRSRKETA